MASNFVGVFVIAACASSDPYNRPSAFWKDGEWVAEDYKATRYTAEDFSKAEQQARLLTKERWARPDKDFPDAFGGKYNPSFVPRFFATLRRNEVDSWMP